MIYAQFGKTSSLNRKPVFLMLALAALPFQAGAIDLTPDPSRIVSDPAYLPSQGQVYGTTAYTFDRTTGDVENYLGAPHRSYTTSADDLTQTLAYGVTDDITFRISEAYDWSRTKSDYTNGTSTSDDSDGFTDPTFGATWRVLDQKVFPVSWDLIGSYAPNWISAKGASPAEDGTIARGGQVATMETAVSYKTRDFTIYTDASAVYLGDRGIYNANGTTTDYKSNWQYTVGLNTQTRLTDLWSVNAGVTETFNNSANATNDTSLVTDTGNPGDVTAFNAALNYQVIPNRLVAGLTYSYDLYSNSSTTYPTLPHDSTTTKNEDGNIFGARLQYVFN